MFMIIIILVYNSSSLLMNMLIWLVISFLLPLLTLMALMNSPLNASFKILFFKKFENLNLLSSLMITFLKHFGASNIWC